MTFERVVRPAGPFTLAHSTKHASDATRHVRDGTLTTTLRVGDRVEVGSVQQTLDGRLVLRAETEAGFERLRFVVAADADHTEFLRRFARDPLIGETTRRFQGMRQLRSPTVAQTLLRAFCGQLIDSRRARELEVGIVRALEPRVEGTSLRAPPTSATFARLAPVRLRQLGLALAAAAPDRPHRVDDEPGRKLAAAGRLGVARFAASEAPALLKDRPPAGAVDRTVDAAAAEQARVRGVDDRVDLLLRQIADGELDHA